ncbi:MAG: hypothetical protein UT94_C0040G0007 [Candidatus Uhrbacteria bacterium GW2011_GWF2_40_263]|nr:MAG: hypothetical protein UT94_C0040G0007 [Candidatus Uhrbacteria bacterium GW2011_GWF2_40_263]
MVERLLAKEKAAGSIPVSRSNKNTPATRWDIFIESETEVRETHDGLKWMGEEK